ALRAGGGRRCHRGAEGEDVVARGDVAVRAVVEERLRGAAADGGEVRGDGDAGAGRAAARRDGGGEKGGAALHDRRRIERADDGEAAAVVGRRGGVARIRRARGEVGGV